MKAMTKETFNYLLLSVCGMLLVASLITALHPQVRSFLQSKVYSTDRVVLSTTVGNVLGDGRLAKIIKVKSEGELFVEIYAYDINGAQELVDKISIGKVKDGYFNVNGQSSNLILDDVDGDRLMEIIVPSFNKDLVANISILKYDEDQLSFVTINN